MEPSPVSWGMVNGSAARFCTFAREGLFVTFAGSRRKRQKCLLLEAGWPGDL